LSFETWFLLWASFLPGDIRCSSAGIFAALAGRHSPQMAPTSRHAFAAIVGDQLAIGVRLAARPGAALYSPRGTRSSSAAAMLQRAHVSRKSLCGRAVILARFIPNRFELSVPPRPPARENAYAAYLIFDIVEAFLWVGADDPRRLRPGKFGSHIAERIHTSLLSSSSFPFLPAVVSILRSTTRGPCSGAKEV